VAQHAEQQYGSDIRADRLGESTKGGQFDMGEVIPFQRKLRQDRLRGLNKYLPIDECEGEFLSVAYLAFQGAARRISSARAEFDQGVPGRVEFTPEFIALAFALYELRPMGVDTLAILESVANQLGKTRKWYRGKRKREIVSAINYANAQRLPTRSAIEQTLGPNGDDASKVIKDRSLWLKKWRSRLGITQAEAARILDYSDRRQIGMIERCGRNPAWEKIFIAIAAENARAEYAKDATESAEGLEGAHHEPRQEEDQETSAEMTEESQARDADPGPELTDEEMPWRPDPNNEGEIIINWDYHDGGGETLREFKERAEAEMREKKGDEWLKANQKYLDNQFKAILTGGLLT
jgi:transcriptional regulator with XRE-family HTH domain